MFRYVYKLEIEGRHYVLMGLNAGSDETADIIANRRAKKYLHKHGIKDVKFKITRQEKHKQIPRV